ncbi:hypothetical protein [Methylorubrum extorquens]|uniref:hypothetical protein n=1 Tax=Methylorubrum extorquens TaxID=408 RepID=UPI0001629703|nr:hypothetical protein [Methylorubrum extorquens]ABY30312.1 hypothetical protein Mext_1913 [Methylorubrum extorquens PA1]KQP89260.1 hypothetical protein ASF55_04075 [Methylobacterium sp. Leaf119]WIU41603.1 hypothetical protein KQ926_10050 [Methylorubrum extorquens]
MTHDDLLDALRSHDALLIHCSPSGKGQKPDDLVYPDDLRKAIQVLDEGRGALCCSVVWPQHTAAFGTVGIVIKPRSAASVLGVVTGDGGTTYDPQTRIRTSGRTVPLTIQNLPLTFTPTTEHNEWLVEDADCIGIYFVAGEYAQVAERVGPPGPDGRYDTQIRNLTMADVKRDFPGLPIFCLMGNGVVGFMGNPY